MLTARSHFFQSPQSSWTGYSVLAVLAAVLGKLPSQIAQKYFGIAAAFYPL
jgi:hypothetical protein